MESDESDGEKRRSSLQHNQSVKRSNTIVEIARKLGFLERTQQNQPETLVTFVIKKGYKLSMKKKLFILNIRSSIGFTAFGFALS